MFGPTVDGWPEAGCPGCSFTADSLDGAVVHLEHRDVTFVATSRAPLAKLNAYRRRMPQGRGDDPEGWPRRHDEYPTD